ncbi:protein Shroom2 isoform X2 [Esox lucius]|uniref:Shroom family member 2 n=1 Tax=Esox lucius TaxID=8010 RepID=A0AAY5L1C7_ESOLU|nr:protein Shroom2 isoform X2 [Esox lucius]
MDVVDKRNELRISAKGVQAIFKADQFKAAGEGMQEDNDGHTFVDVLLFGGAPWGFTLRGGLEHREPLHITKVEDGGKAAAVCLQAGDEIVSINTVPLSGSREEAICLVKGSHRTLALVVRRKNRFKGSNETASWPQSWQPSRFTEDHRGATERYEEPPDTPVCQVNHEMSASTTDLSSCEDHNLDLRQISSQFISVRKMERVERPSRPYPSACVSPSWYRSSAEPSSVGKGSAGKRDSAFSCLSSSSPPPESAPPLAGTEGSMFYKGLQTQSSEVARQAPSRHLQLPQGIAGWESPGTVPEEQPGSRYSSSGSAHGSRSHIGPVWHVPERRTAAPSPPPPPPPLRSDSFAATKVFPAYTEGPGAPLRGQVKVQGRGGDKLAEGPESNAYRVPGYHIAHLSHVEKAPEARRGYIQPCGKEFPLRDVPAGAPDYNHNQLHLQNKLFSLSSQDVRQSQSSLPSHQRQYSDESPFYLQSRTAPHPPKPQSVGSYYRSLQELPTDLFNGRNQVKSSTASLSSSTIDQNHDSAGQIRYYCITTKQPDQPEGHARPGKAEVWRNDTELAKATKDRGSVSSSHNNRVKYPLPPQSQTPHPDCNSKERNGHSKPASSLIYEHKTSTSSSWSGKCITEERGERSEGRRPSSEAHLRRSCSPSPPKVHQTAPLRGADPQVCLDIHKISPKKTPMLHSLAQDGGSPAERKPPATTPSASSDGGTTHHEASADGTAAGRLARRSDRYATTLRNEIQLKRAQLQKSRSAATLSCPSETEEQDSHTDLGAWRSNEASTFSSEGSSSYKDHLKEAQARVLQATSFRRRDLEPSGSGLEASLTKPDGHVVSRIGSRKRFPLNKRIHSFSEPDKINTLGVDRERSGGTPGSFVDRRKFFEMAAKPAFSKPIPALPNPGQQNSSTGGHGEGKGRGRAQSGDTEGDHRSDRQAQLEQQRLGTFAEYQATWGMQGKTPDTKTQGRYHSAENILDQGTEMPACIHERSRSSPSADFGGKNKPVPWTDSVENPYLDYKQDQHGSSTTREQSESGDGGQSSRQHQFPQPPQPSIPRLTDSQSHCDSSDVATPTLLPHPSDHTRKTDPTGPAHAPPPYPPDHTRSSVSGRPHAPPAAGPLNAGLVAPSWSPQGLEASPTTSSSCGHSAQEFVPGSHSHQTDPVEAPSSSSRPDTELYPAPKQASAWPRSPSPGGTARLNTEEEKEEVAADSSSPVHPHQSASLLVASSDGTRCASPRLPPPTLTDQPPIPRSTQDEAQGRSENRTDKGMEIGGGVKKVPVKIVHSESPTERENRQYLLNSDANWAPGSFEGPKLPWPQQTSLPSHEPQPYSLFCAYTPSIHKDTPSVPNPSISAKEVLSLGPSQTNGTSCNSGLQQQPPKCCSEEDAKREELARDIMDKDKSLVDILDQSKMKTTMDLMEGIFPRGDRILDAAHQRRKVSPKRGLPPRSSEDRGGAAVPVAALVTSSSYYSTSAPKAELLNRMKGMQEDELGVLEQDSGDELDVNLASKKQELIDSLSRKLQVLREARESLREDVQDNNALGDEVEASVQRVCRPNELEKFKMFVGDLDKVVSLLLSLSGRLARVENALNSLEEDTTPEERRTLTEKRKLLIRQHEDAKELKENLDRRERLVYTIMAAHLSKESLADYKHFVKMKSALIIEQRKLEDKIKLGEEQLKCLLDSLSVEQRLLF